MAKKPNLETEYSRLAKKVLLGKPMSRREVDRLYDLHMARKAAGPNAPA